MDEFEQYKRKGASSSGQGVDDFEQYKRNRNKGLYDRDEVERTIPVEPNKHSMLETALLHGANGITLAKTPQIYGAINAVRHLPDDGLDEDKFVENYRKGKTYVDKSLEESAKEYPWTAFLSGAAGGAATGALAPALNAGLKGAMLTGAITNFDSDPKGDLVDSLIDAGKGAVFGAGLHKGLGLASNLTFTGMGKKGASWLLNTPEELTEAYIKNPEAIKNAPTRFELGKDFGKSLDRLAEETTGGSQLSRDILDAEGKKISGERISRALGNIADKMYQRSEGVWDSAQKKASYEHIRDLADEYGKKIPLEDFAENLGKDGALSPMDTLKKVYAEIQKNAEKSGNQIPLEKLTTGEARQFSTNRLKDLVQELEQGVSYTPKGSGTGTIPLKGEAAQKEARAAIDSILKGESPAYTKQMERVAADAELLKKAKEIGENPQRIINIFRRLNTDEYGSGQLPKETLEALDKRLGTDFINQAKNATMKEAFDKSVTNGSKNVRLYSGMFKGTPLEPVAEILGSAVDAGGRKMTMSAIDAAIVLRKAYNLAPGRKAFEAVAAPIFEAAKKGNKEAALAVTLFNKQQNNQED